MLLSIVIPVYNEEESLALLLEQIHAVVAEQPYQTEVIFVDDGSKDTSWSVITELASKNPEVRALRFRRNFGKAAALEAGFGLASGDFVLTMDADLQDDPAEIPNFLAKLDEGFDVVSGWKKIRHDPWHKVLPSRVFNRWVSRLSGVKLHDHNCGMKCYRAAVIRELPIFGERHRFLPVLAGSLGFRVGEIIIHHRKRQFGVSKYGFSRFMKGFMDLYSVRFITQFAQRPQHLMGIQGMKFGGFGLAMFLLTKIVQILVKAEFFALANPWNLVLDEMLGAILLLALVSMLFGGMLFAVGMLAELVTAFHQTPQVHNFIISEAINNSKQDS